MKGRGEFAAVMLVAGSLISGAIALLVKALEGQSAATLLAISAGFFLGALILLWAAGGRGEAR